MRKKNFLKLISVVALTALFLQSCKQEENKVDVLDPVVEITSHDLEGLPGESVNLTAKVIASNDPANASNPRPIPSKLNAAISLTADANIFIAAAKDMRLNAPFIITFVSFAMILDTTVNTAEITVMPVRPLAIPSQLR